MAVDSEQLFNQRLKRIRSKKLRDAVSELAGWMPSEVQEFNVLVWRILASLPGGERLEDMGFETFEFLGWKEADMIGKLLEGIENKEDVEMAVDALLAEDDAQQEG